MRFLWWAYISKMNLHVEKKNTLRSYDKLTKNRKFPKIATPYLLVLIKIEKAENKYIFG